MINMSIFIDSVFKIHLIENVVLYIHIVSKNKKRIDKKCISALVMFSITKKNIKISALTALTLGPELVGKTSTSYSIVFPRWRNKLINLRA